VCRLITNSFVCQSRKFRFRSRIDSPWSDSSGRESFLVIDRMLGIVSEAEFVSRRDNSNSHVICERFPLNLMCFSGESGAGGEGDERMGREKITAIY
jgi:hypothetical protein